MQSAKRVLSETRILLTEVVSASHSSEEYAAALRRVYNAAIADDRGSSWTLLPLLACQVFDGTPNRAMPVAAAWEALAIAAKLLDDVEDGLVTRVTTDPRDVGRVVNLATAFIAASNLALERLPEDVYGTLVGAFNRTIIKMGGGQHTELTTGETLDLAGYFRVMAAKSGAFFGLAARAGARCATDNSLYLDPLESFGFNVGILVQIMDDLADLREPADASGALQFDQCSLPVLYALDVAPPDERMRLEQFLTKAGADASVIPKAQQLIVDLGGELYLLAETIRYRRRALAALDELDVDDEATAPLRHWLAGLETATQYATDRANKRP